MAWALSAHGETSPADEEALREWLADVLADPRFGTQGSQWATASHNGPIHTQVKVKKTRKADG